MGDGDTPTDPFGAEEPPEGGAAGGEDLEDLLRPAPLLRGRERTKASTQEPWTLVEGARDVLRFLARRALVAVLVWLALAATLAWFCGMGAVAGDLSWFTGTMAIASFFSGMSVGYALSSGLLDAVHFCGWVPWTLATGASTAVCVG